MATERCGNKNKINPIAVIPARGGSVRIPGKNLADFDGHPSIVRVIHIALESSIFNRVIVTQMIKTSLITPQRLVLR